mgnify:CR=1 FL=1
MIAPANPTPYQEAAADLAFALAEIAAFCAHDSPGAVRKAARAAATISPVLRERLTAALAAGALVEGS